MKKYVWLFLIVLLAAALRFWHVTQVPPALNSDEVAIGYNAYSILKTGRDEYGARLPLTFRSFDDYKMPMYVYMVSGSMKLFGYGDFAVRFPSALFGTLTVFVTYFLVKELFKRWDARESIALFSALFLSISPWSLQFSRSGYEANVAVFFIVLGVYLFLKGLSRGWLMTASSISLSLAVWTYLTPRIFVPFLVLGLALIYGKALWKIKYAAAVAIVVAAAILWPIARMSLSPEGQMRAAGVSAFNNAADLAKSADRTLRDQSAGMKYFTVFDNRRLTYAVTFLRGYFEHFDPTFLFLDKSIEKYRAPDVGLLYVFELPLLLAGSYVLVRKWSPASAVIFWWVAIAPIAAAFTLQLPHPVRTLVFLPTFQIISAAGVVLCIHQLKKRTSVIRYMLGFTGIFIVLVSVAYYLHQYYVVLPVEDAPYWYVGRKEMTQELTRVKSEYDAIYVSNSLDFPYVFYLYYSHTDPAVYRRQGGTVSGGFEEQRNHVGNIYFRSINTSLRNPLKKILFVGMPGEVFKKSLVVHTVHFPDGTPAIVFFQ